MILAIRTDKPEAELYLLNKTAIIDSAKWEAHKQLSNTLLEKIEELLGQNNFTRQDLTGVIVYQGPGSFTGLRIGISVANTLAYALTIPIAGSSGDSWISDGTGEVVKNQSSQLVVPAYGQDPHITKQRK